MKLDHRSRRGDEGSALIIALIFLTTIAVIVAAILSFTDVGLKASKAYDFKARASRSYTADGWLTTAIQRYSSTGPCDNFTAPPINGVGPIIRCEGPAPAGSKATQPVNSLLSLGGPITSTEELRLLGDAYAKTSLTTEPGDPLIVQGQVSAEGACTGPIQVSPPSPLRCANGSPPVASDPTRGRDPDYNPETVAVPVRRTVPPCPRGARWLVTLEPGYYDDAAALSALTSSPACNDKVVWLRPGAYYFDLGFRGGPTTWTVANPSVTVVGGEPKGWATSAATRPQINVPGSCKADGDPGPFAGVQIVAGGSTRIDVTEGRMELCATPSTTDQQIALFGLGPELPGDVHLLEASDITATGFTSALGAQTIGELPVRVAQATLSNPPPPTPGLLTASLAFAAFSPAVPSGSVIDAVTLRIRHQEGRPPAAPSTVTDEQAAAALDALTVTLDFPGSVCGADKGFTQQQVLAPSPGTFKEDQIADLGLTCGLSSPEQLAKLAVTYTAKLKPDATVDALVQLDGVSLEVRYHTPTTRKPTVVLGTAGFSDAGDALEIGELDRPLPTATLDVGASASIEVAGLNEPPLRASATDTVRSVRFRVAHRDQDARTTLLVPFRGGVCSLTLPKQTDVLADDRVDLADCPGSRPKITPADVNGLTSVKVVATLSSGAPATVLLDGVWLEVAGDTTDPPPPTIHRADSATSPAPGFAAPESATVIDGPAAPSATADLSGPIDTASLRVAGFNRVPVAPGSKIDSVFLRVAHQEDANVESVAGVTDPLPSYPSGCQLPIPSSMPGVPAIVDLDLKALCPLASIEELAGLGSAVYAAKRRVLTGAAGPATASDAVGFVEPNKGRAIDGDATAAPLAGTAQTAKVTLSGSSLPTPPPDGSNIDTATLRLVHRETGNIAPDGVTALVKFNGSNAACAEPRKLATRNGTTLEVDTSVNLRECGLTDTGQLASLSVTYQVTGGGTTGEAFLDGAAVDLTYRPRALALLDGIELVIQSQPPRLRPVCPQRGCDLLKVGPGADPVKPTRFVAAGTVYAPRAGVDISLRNLDHQVLKRGLVARSIRLGLAPRDGFDRPTVVIPPELVTFTAYPDRTLEAQVATSSGFADENNAKVLDEQPTARTATAALAGAGSASLQLGQFDFRVTTPPQADLPFREVIDAAVLRIRHKDDGTTVKVVVASGPTPCVVQELPTRAAMTVDQIDLVPNVSNPPSGCKVDRRGKIGALTVTYTVTSTAAATPELDGITLEVLSGPLVRAQVTFNGDEATVARGT